MAVTLNASTSTGLVQSADTSGEINLQSNGTTVLGVTSTGTSVTGTQSVSGNLSFNSGYGSSAVAYGCRAWVNFNGSGTVAIRGSGNVTSITDNGTGDFTINFTTAMPDANYAVMSNGAEVNTSGLGSIGLRLSTSPTTTTVRVGATDGAGGAFDMWQMHFAIFR
jgi:hypothetical protein